jgi:lipase
MTARNSATCRSPAWPTMRLAREKRCSCLHGSAGSSDLWRRAMDSLQLLYRVVTPDLIGYGGSAPWSTDGSFDLDDEARALRTLLPCCGDKYHLVGYSYGGVVGLHLALADPGRVRTLTLIEPVFFAALRYAGEVAAYDRLCRIRDDFSALLARGERETAMQQFIDFWTGAGSWVALPGAMRSDMLKLAGKIVLDWGASFAADPGRDRLAAVARRTMLVRGDRSPEPMRRLVDALYALMPGSTRTIVSGANHLLPLTHGPTVINTILAHLHADAERRMR